MRTPEEIASRIANDYLPVGTIRTAAFLAIQKDIAAALRAYGDARAAAERQRCEAAATARALGWDGVLDKLQEEQPGTLRIEHVGPFSRWLEACDIAALINKPDWGNAEQPAPG